MSDENNSVTAAVEAQQNIMPEEITTQTEAQTTQLSVDDVYISNINECPADAVNGEESKAVSTSNGEEKGGVDMSNNESSFVSFIVPIRCLSQLSFSMDTCWLGISEDSLGTVFEEFLEKRKSEMTSEKKECKDMENNNNSLNSTLLTSNGVFDNVEALDTLSSHDNNMEDNREVKDSTSNEKVGHSDQLQSDNYSAKPKRTTIIIATIPSRKSIVAYGFLLGSRIQRHKLKEREKKDMPLYWNTVVKVGWVKVAECAFSDIGLAIDTLQPVSVVDPVTGYGIITGEKRDREVGEGETVGVKIQSGNNNNSRSSTTTLQSSANISVSGSTNSSPQPLCKSVANSKTRPSSAAHDPEVKALSEWIQRINEEELTRQGEANYVVKWTQIPDSLCTSDAEGVGNKLASSIDGSSLRLLPNDLRNYFLNPAHGMAIARKNNEAQMKGQHHQFQQRAHLTNQTYHDMYVGSRVPHGQHHQQYHNSYHNHMYSGAAGNVMPLPNHTMYGSNSYGATPYGVAQYGTSVQYGMPSVHTPQQGYPTNMYAHDHSSVRQQLPYRDQQQSYSSSNHRSMPSMVSEHHMSKRSGHSPTPEAGRNAK